MESCQFSPRPRTKETPEVAAIRINRTHRILVGVVVAGAILIAGIGFVGSYAAVRELAERKGFGAFAPVFPIGIDAGIVVLLSLDLLLTWLRIPFPMLRQAAWLLTAATISFNGAAAWPDPLGTGMHAVIPLLFIVTVEAARHAIGRIADITADRHMESVRVARWLLAFPSTFRLWRRMKLWELRSYEEVIRLERDRLVYQARLRGQYGRRWRHKAPLEALMPLKLARYGVPLAETASAGLSAAGIRPEGFTMGGLRAEPAAAGSGHRRVLAGGNGAALSNGVAHSNGVSLSNGAVARTSPAAVTPPATVSAPAPEPAAESAAPPEPQRKPVTSSNSVARPAPASGRDGTSRTVRDVYFAAFCEYTDQHRDFPTPAQLAEHLMRSHGITGRDNGPLHAGTLRRYLPEFRRRYREILDRRSAVAAAPSAAE